MSQQDGFGSGFLLGTLIGGVVGGVLGAVITSRLDLTANPEEDNGLTIGDNNEPGVNRKRRMRASANENLEIEANYPVATISLKVLNVLQDFIAPFYRFVKSYFKVNYVYIDDVYIPSEIRLESSAEIKVMGIKSKAFQYSTELKFSKLNEFRIASSTSNITAICEN